jgi:hypothetical protein
VAWMAPSPKGFLLGITWDHGIDPETHPALAVYVDPHPATQPARATAPAKRRQARTRR